MRWQRGFSWLVLATIPAILSMWGTLGCGPGEPKPAINFTVANQFPMVSTKVPVTVEAKDNEGKLVPDGTTLVVSVTPAGIGGFDDKATVAKKNLTTSNGIASFDFYTGAKAGTAIINVQSEFTSKNLSLIILEEEKPPEPKPEKKAEKQDDAGPEKNTAEKDAGRYVPLTIKLEARKTKLKADGKDVTEITAKITEPILPPAEIAGLKMVFRTSLGALLDPETGQPLKAIPKTNGEYEVPFNRNEFKVLLRSGVRAGTAIVEAGISNLVYDGTNKIQVNIVELGFIEFQEIKPNTIGTQGSGKEVTTVSVKVLDTNNENFPEGTRVYFNLTKPIGGASVTTSEALSNDKGIAFTQVKSGRDVGTVTVKALVAIEVDPKVSGCPVKCNDDSDCNSCGYSCHLGTCKKTIEALSSSIAIVGGRPSYRGLTFSCESRNIGAMAGRVGTNIVNTINTNCTVKLADRFTNKVGFSTQVIFMTEAGAIDPSASTKANAGAGGIDVGTVTVSVRTQNPPPVDVPPFSVPNTPNCKDPQCTQPQNGGYWKAYNCTKSTTIGSAKTLYVEPWYTDKFGNVRNPRDGVVTIVAYTNGEEQFTDTNKNGRYDVGEPFIDLGEPYLDVNDNGQWDARLAGLPNGEPFVDIPCSEQQAKNGTNGCKQANVGNGRRDGPNGLWDEDTIIWKKTWVVWSGCLKRNIDPKLLNPAVNLDACTEIPFQSGMYSLKSTATSGLNASAADSYGLNNFEPLKSYLITPSTPVRIKALWHDENLNPIVPEATGTMTVQNLLGSLSPQDGNFAVSNFTGFGFEPHSLLSPASGSAFVGELVMVPTSFLGVEPSRLFTHRITLSDADQKLSAKPVPASFSVEIKIPAGQFSCGHIEGGSGNSQ